MIACAKESERFGHIDELVRPVNDRYQFSGFKQFIHICQILVGFQHNDTDVLVRQARGTFKTDG